MQTSFPAGSCPARWRRSCTDALRRPASRSNSNRVDARRGCSRWPADDASRHREMRIPSSTARRRAAPGAQCLPAAPARACWPRRSSRCNSIKPVMRLRACGSTVLLAHHGRQQRPLQQGQRAQRRYAIQVFRQLATRKVLRAIATTARGMSAHRRRYDTAARGPAPRCRRHLPGHAA